MTKKIDSSGSCEKERIRDEIDEQIREYLRKGGRIQVLSRPETDVDTNRGSGCRKLPVWAAFIRAAQAYPGISGSHQGGRPFRTPWASRTRSRSNGIPQGRALSCRIRRQSVGGQ